MDTRGTMTMARMDEWPACQRRGTWLVGWALYAGGFRALLAWHGIPMQGLALVIVCAGLLLLAPASGAVLNERMRNINRRQVRVIVPAFLVYMLVVLYVMPLANRLTLPWLKAVVVLSPMLPVLFIAWAVIRCVNRCDEMERRQHLEAAGFAVVVVGVACMSLGLLAAAKLVAANGPLVLLMVLPALCVVYGVACTRLKWRNRAR